MLQNVPVAVFFLPNLQNMSVYRRNDQDRLTYVWTLWEAMLGDQYGVESEMWMIGVVVAVG
jgi:hypothetical protein